LRGTQQEMILQNALGVSLIFSQGVTKEAHAALSRAVKLAECQNNSGVQFQSLFGLSIFCLHLGKLRSALSFGRRCEATARSMTDSLAAPTAERILGILMHFRGKHAQAQTHLERALKVSKSVSSRANIVRFGVHNRVSALCCLANALWQQGLRDRAAQASLAALDEARLIGHPLSLCEALAWAAGTVSLKNGDLAAAEQYIEELIRRSHENLLDVYSVWGSCLKGKLRVQQDRIVEGLDLLREGLDGLSRTRFFLFYSEFLSMVACGETGGGRIEDGLRTIDQALNRAERNEESWHLPETLRIKGEILLKQDELNAGIAEEHFLRSLDFARKQGALSWELRSAMSLARLPRQRGCRREACELLASVYGRFSEGFWTADMVAAKRLLDKPI
jgi:tetratricopeptide (TPR) repeat protein